MGNLVYAAIASLDGYIEDEDGDSAGGAGRGGALIRQRPLAAGRHPPPGTPDVRGAARLGDPGPRGASRASSRISRSSGAADKIVYSRTLEAVTSARTRLERDFDPEAVRQTEGGGGRDLTIAGPDSPPGRSKPAWSTSATCSSRPSWWRRQAGPPRRCPAGARAARRTPLRQRHGSSPLPREECDDERSTTKGGS